MATTKVSSLTEITSTTGSEELLINDGGTSKKIQVSNLPDTDTTYSNFAGTTAGLVPTSTTGDDTKFLRADGTWVVPTDTDTNTNQLTTFTVSATTDTTPTTISQGDDLMFTAGTGITCETTADGTVTITNTVTDTDTTYSTATTSTEGLVKIEDGTTQTIAANTATATASRTYGVQLNGTGQAVVNVPWVDTDTDTDTTYSTATATTEGLVKIEDGATQSTAANAVTTTASRTYGVQLNASDQAVVNVPWTDTDTGITDVVDDTTPQLGGSLDVNGNSIVSASNGDIAITPNGTGDVVLDGLKYPQADGTAGYVLKTDGSAQLSWVAQTTDTDTVYTHPTTAGNKHVPTGGSSGQFLKYDSSGTAVWAADNDTVYTHPTGDGNIHVPAYGSSTSGQLLTSAGTSSTPSWQDAPQGVSNSKLFYFGSFN